MKRTMAMFLGALLALWMAAPTPDAGRNPMTGEPTSGAGYTVAAAAERNLLTGEPGSGAGRNPLTGDPTSGGGRTPWGEPASGAGRTAA